VVVVVVVAVMVIIWSNCKCNLYYTAL
jgi:hypothetical protein